MLFFLPSKIAKGERAPYDLLSMMRLLRIDIRRKLRLRHGEVMKVDALASLFWGAGMNVGGNLIVTVRISDPQITAKNTSVP